MDPEVMEELFSYNYWAFERVWACIARLTDAQFTQEIDYSRGSIRNQVVHLMSATQRWVYRLQRLEPPPRLVFEDFHTLAETRSKWDELQAETLAYIHTLTRAQLDESIRWEVQERGYMDENRRWELLLHAANHGTDHRAQILAILNQHFGLETPEQDMIIYLRERQEKPV
jgi:uncharacterized damage-inducible protein DinB